MTSQRITADNAVNHGGLDGAGAEAKKYNKRLVESWKHDMEGLLVFAVLFSRAREFLHNFVGIDGSRIFYDPGRLRVQTAVKIAPLLLYTSLLLFFGGLAAFIIPVDLPMDIIAATLVGIIAAISCQIAVQYLHTSAAERHSHHHRVRAEEARGVDQPGFENVVEELRRQNADQRELLVALSETWRAEYTRQHEETITAVRSTAREQVDFNVQGYLDEFSKALATEVKVLLGEVGKLREERRDLQHELGYLLSMKSNYGPGGKFEPDWKPAPGAPGGPPLDPNPRHSQQSWATWQPDPNLAPTPPAHDPTLLVPDISSPGLFGPRSPRSSASKSPHPPAQSWATRQPNLNSAPTLNKGEVPSWANWQPDPNLMPTPPAPEAARRQVQSWATWQVDPLTDPILALRPPPPEAPRPRAAGPSVGDDPKAGGDRDAVAISPPRERARLPMVPEIRRSGV
ncbi:hypothetical protein MSAN_00966700 [Mycena sanguinolenta]|uniref:DUF6535 domain-containing protein n=1 Tax=Mycena sanguinolenta TaxID=230812 RepID=A0A8H6YVC2_9AGAR|nr:hypothetical protein MSAN_00966700 [Mycena sanguinolenta]